MIWEGLNAESLENCNLITNYNGIKAESTISLCLNDTLCHIEYYISLNQNWECQYCKIIICRDDGRCTIELKRLPGDQWSLNGKPEKKYDRCEGIDISITPFTNSFIINREKLPEGSSIALQVIYIDAIKMECEPINVRYTKLSPKEFEYENLTTGFNAVLDIDENGFVTFYPSYFKMLKTF